MKFNRPDNISDNAYLVLEQVCDNYLLNNSKEFEDFSHISLSIDDMRKAFQELHDKRFVFYHNDLGGEYLYALDKVFYIVSDYQNNHLIK